MRFIKDLGGAIGKISGGVVGGAVKATGEIINSKTLKK